MVHLYVFNPAPKLRLLSTLFVRGSKRILGTVSESTSPLSAQSRSQQCTPFSLVPLEAPRLPEGQLVRDPDYYANSRKGFCAFLVENTLFNVHQVILSREPSAFDDMLCLPRPVDSTEGSEETPVFLTDTVEQFRDLLWALYAPPNELFHETGIDRLLNIAEMANKYCFFSLEAWTIEHIHALAADSATSGLLQSASPSTCGRIMDVAVLCGHVPLKELVAQRLVSRTLWYNTSPELILDIAERHGLRTLIGVCYYKQLISMECSGPSHSNSKATQMQMQTQTILPPSFNIDQSMLFLAAHRSLISLWEQIRSMPPPLPCEGCPSHSECELAWQIMWFQAGEVDETLRRGSADILGRMKSLMLGLRKAMADAPLMTMQCKMAALEAITGMRDEVLECLILHFTKTL
ncbi:hypothetical protein DXG03_001978 [Asterophora parasitica]|uniref:BTB domain-containing protein n=1 Tax=Asterophora parasitica TaxID=117018 RepID=A0A9P7GH23_9AGAR|nr:hypothetical protein DXG03_001978 [Asterophora parasitica]